MKLKPPEIIEQFEIPEEYHHAIWEAYSAGARYGFFKALHPVIDNWPDAETIKAVDDWLKTKADTESNKNEVNFKYEFDGIAKYLPDTESNKEGTGNE